MDATPLGAGGHLADADDACTILYIDGQWSPEGERERLDAGIEELDCELSVGDRSRTAGPADRDANRPTRGAKLPGEDVRLLPGGKVPAAVASQKNAATV
jgi:hypothetical protein